MRCHAPDRVVSVSPLTPQSFAPFGEVIQNPATHDELDGNGEWRLQHQIANQGSATKWLDVTKMENYYGWAPSRKAAKVAMNMFVCKPRKLHRSNGNEVFPVSILERHPFTPQTFIPMGLSKVEQGTYYLVIVAPTLPSKVRKSFKERLLGARPNPFTNDYQLSTTPSVAPPSRAASQRPKGTGMPDLENLRAFIARGDQAVTYGPGTWHAPMVVLGKKEIDFVVVQYANGVGNEDCQECELEAGDAESLVVDVGNDMKAADCLDASKPGYMRAKL